ncbi:hypothetical protein PMIN06_005622 [Paraphaeosphaeria minitans]
MNHVKGIKYKNQLPRTDTITGIPCASPFSFTQLINPHSFLAYSRSHLHDLSRTLLLSSLNQTTPTSVLRESILTSIIGNSAIMLQNAFRTSNGSIPSSYQVLHPSCKSD